MKYNLNSLIFRICKYYWLTNFIYHVILISSLFEWYYANRKHQQNFTLRGCRHRIFHLLNLSDINGHIITVMVVGLFSGLLEQLLIDFKAFAHNLWAIFIREKGRLISFLSSCFRFCSSADIFFVKFSQIIHKTIDFD